jgi:hypothetical protein
MKSLVAHALGIGVCDCAPAMQRRLQLIFQLRVKTPALGSRSALAVWCTLVSVTLPAVKNFRAEVSAYSKEASLSVDAVLIEDDPLLYRPQ